MKVKLKTGIIEDFDFSKINKDITSKLNRALDYYAHCELVYQVSNSIYAMQKTKKVLNTSDISNVVANALTSLNII